MPRREAASCPDPTSGVLELRDAGDVPQHHSGRRPQPGGDRLEFLSPSNKRIGSYGRALYLQKQEELLRSRTSLLEIDLLRAGAHTVAAPRALLVEKGRWDYVACLHRASRPERFEVWPMGIRHRLPRIFVPLGEAEPDVVLDLQAVFDRMYDAGPYPRRLDYRRDPPLPLDPPDAAWAEAILRQKGLRQEA